MKKLFTLFAAVLLTACVFAQTQDYMSYQSVIRDTDNNLITNQNVGMQISILQGSISGPEVYVETHETTTNTNGLVSLKIGDGFVVSGDYELIDWSDGPYFLKTETDPAGGTNYTITGTSQLLSVPYALHAKTAETVVEYTETDPTVPQYVKDIESGDIDNWNEAYAWGDHSEVGYLTDYTVTEEDVTAHQEALEITESQITDLQDYYLATNPDGFISDYTVTEEDVTAHEEALEITESQITDLQDYYLATNPDGFISDYIVTEADVTTHQAALEITESQITDLQDYYLATNPDGFISDYTVTEEDVIAHQEALEITESQITDLQDYYLATNPDGFISDYTVTEEDVTTHQEALEITESQITDFGNYIETETDPLFSAWDKDYEDLTNKPDLAPVAITGSYNDLTDKPQGSAVGEMQYWDGSEWVTVPVGNEGQILAFVNGVPKWTTPQIAISDVFNFATGKIWMDRNLGASQVATSSTDEDSYGDLYQWGRAADGHQIRTSGTTSTLSNSDTPGHGDFITISSSPWDWRNPQNDNLWQGVSGINNPCPPGYRLPTEAEWEAERQSWSSNNAAGAFASPLKLPMAGSRNYINGSLNNVGSHGYYCSSTVIGSFSRRLYFGSSDANMFSYYRAFGFSVRCIKD